MGQRTMLLANLTLGDFLWSLLAFFFMVIYFMILFQCIADLFRDHETSGVVKALWVFFFLIAPFLSILIYLIVRGSGMAKRQVDAAQKMDADMRQYVAQTGGTGTPTQQLKEAKELLDAGTIDQADYDKLKAKIVG